MNLSKRTQIVYDFIVSHYQQHGTPPMLTEICDHLGINHGNRGNVKTNYIKKLQGLNLIDQRNVPVLKDVNANDLDKFKLPIVGSIAAGQPIDASEVLEHFDFSKIILNKGLYMLTVKGNSMVDAGILDGETVMMKKQNIAKNGDIVAALIDNQTEATLKEFKLNSDYTVTLITHNRQAVEEGDLPAELVYNADQIYIDGIYTGLRFDKNQLNRLS
ncbi:MAG: repressor LexA [Francisellaceae bacterium]|jgi:repressor LexA